MEGAVMRVPFSVKACTVAAVLLAAAVAPAPAQAAAKDLSSLDKAFVDAAGHGGAFEVESGKVAADRATNSALRSFGRQMVKDHTKAGDKLATLAKDLGLTAPDKPDSVQRAIIGIWSGLSGAAFDCSYGPTIYADHGADVGLFEREAADGQNAKLRTFARDTLPTLREHLAMAATNVKNLSCGNGNVNDVPTPRPTSTWTGRPDPWPTWTGRPDPWPTMRPTHRPTHGPTYRPTTHPTAWPTNRPRQTPTATPSRTRTVRPTPTTTRTIRPTGRPTLTLWPTALPTSWPTRFPLPTSTVTVTLPTTVP
ncbi:DUF4142 domain-containing protein [Dactylosporangium sp. NPDC051541]|uniref:DUF4142 domain-containing protein n=1 Tax=Dactylosporangium sp. NPDC051541 TaxID=3363977 RepID=UPI0037AAB7ED